MVNVVWVVIGVSIFAALGWGLAATFAALWSAADRDKNRLLAELARRDRADELERELADAGSLGPVVERGE